jgi:hypothetical protein
MFKKITRAAEKMAEGVSRRGFLGRLSQAALGTAAVVGGLLAFPGAAQAGRCSFGGGNPFSRCCEWLCNGAYYYTRLNGNGCGNAPARGCILISRCTGGPC